MSKDCKDCEYFGGYNCSDGTPYCDYDGGYECCPYNNETGTTEKKTENGIRVEIDCGFMSDFIRETIINTSANIATKLVNAEISKIVTESYKAEIQEMTKRAIEETVEKQVSDFMSGSITVGGGWMEPERTLTRTEYMSELVQKELGKRFNEDSLKKEAKKETESAINAFSRKLKDEINMGIKQYFDAATRSVLTENVVSMLMNNDTYKRLSDSMQTFLPTGESK